MEDTRIIKLNLPELKDYKLDSHCAVCKTDYRSTEKDVWYVAPVVYEQYDYEPEAEKFLVFCPICDHKIDACLNTLQKYQFKKKQK
jgi:hypothetical protein